MILVGTIFLVLATLEMFGAMSIDMVPCMRKADIAFRVHVRRQRNTRKKQGDQRKERCKRTHMG